MLKWCHLSVNDIEHCTFATVPSPELRGVLEHPVRHPGYATECCLLMSRTLIFIVQWTVGFAPSSTDWCLNRGNRSMCTALSV